MLNMLCTEDINNNWYYSNDIWPDFSCVYVYVCVCVCMFVCIFLSYQFELFGIVETLFETEFTYEMTIIFILLQQNAKKNHMIT